MNPDLVDALREKLDHLELMRQHLEYSLAKVRAWWSAERAFREWNADQLESLAALKARFAELQDHLAAAMRLVATIEEEPTEVFSYVLNYMVQVGVLPNEQVWRELRNLRYAAVHDYSSADHEKSLHYQGLLDQAQILLQVHTNLKGFAARVYGISTPPLSPT
ncbi:MAG: hypothetical protein ACK4TK_09170 [Thiobacillaceae bacterium]